MFIKSSQICKDNKFNVRGYICSTAEAFNAETINYKINHGVLIYAIKDKLTPIHISQWKHNPGVSLQHVSHLIHGMGHEKTKRKKKQKKKKTFFHYNYKHLCIWNFFPFSPTPPFVDLTFSSPVNNRLSWKVYDFLNPLLSPTFFSSSHHYHTTATPYSLFN